MQKEIYKALKQSALECEDPDKKRKMTLFLRAMEIGPVRACEEFGTYPRYYYYWWNRYSDSGFKVETLAKRSLHPKRAPRKINDTAVTWIRNYREAHGHGPERIRLLLEHQHQIRLSIPSICRVIKKEGLPLLRRRSNSIPGTREFSDLPWRKSDWVERVAEKIHSRLARTGGRLEKTEIVTVLQSGLSEKQEAAPVSPFPLFANRYEIEREIGRGGGGVVYLAGDRRMGGRRIALKVVEGKKGESSSLAFVLKNEFATLRALHHPHLARVFDFGITDREIYFSSEWIEGNDILTVAQEANLNTVFQLLIQVLAALDFLHRRGVLHLDLKPSNILVSDPERTGDLTVKVIDFGTARWSKKGEPFQGGFVGTLPYAAPETIRGEVPSRASDLYSLGMIFHQIFAGRFPFGGGEPLEMMKEQIYGQPLKVTKKNPALPEGFSDLLLKMVAREPQDRFQSVTELLHAINDCLGEDFSLRGTSAPLRVLEDSDFLFRRELVEDLIRIFSEEEARVVFLSGPSGIGKSHVVRRLKEELQLRGRQPLWVEGKAALEGLLKDFRSSAKDPLLIDAVELTREEMIPLLDVLENLLVPVLLTTQFSPSLRLNPSRWTELNPLDSASISQFLEYELSDFPVTTFSQTLADLCKGIPSELEKWLLVLKEEGLIQWAGQGWRWLQGEEEIDFPRLLVRSRTRWEERCHEVQEILRFSRLPLDAKTLEGVLGLEAGVLGEKLSEWVVESKIASKKIKGIFHYFLKKIPLPGPRTPWIRDWNWAYEELKSLYDQGAFERGIQFADFLETKASQKEIPEGVSLITARHFVAGGFPEKALSRLPKTPPTDRRHLGLYHEIKARAFYALGEYPQAEESLGWAEQGYDALSDGAGLSRVFNLIGSIRRRLQDFAQAEGYFLKAIAAAKQAGEAYHQGMAQMNLAVFYQDQGRFAQAQELYEATFPLEKTAGQPLLSCKLRDNWVNLLFYTGRSAEAESAAYDLLKTAVHSQYTEPQASALAYLALLAGQKGQWDLQLNYLNRALSLLHPRQQPQLYMQSSIDRGYVHLSLKKFVPAQIDAEFVLDLAQRRSQTLFQALASLLLGKILRDRPHPDLAAATRFLNEAHRLAYQNQMGQLLWEVEFDRGLLAKKKGELIRARNYFLSAEKELQDFLLKLPDPFRKNYLRDRKQERILAELTALNLEEKK